MHDLAAIERELQGSLFKACYADFKRYFWPVVTGAPCIENRVTAAIDVALQDVGDGTTDRLVLSKPPGCGVSTSIALYHGWRIARDPSWRTMNAGHSYELAATTSRRVRRLVTSPEFRRLFPIALRDDAAQISLWETSRGGHFIAVGRDSNVTGRRCNELVCDDLNAAADKYSKTALEHAWLFFAETLSTRVDNDRSAMIVAAQRTAVADVPGRLAEQGGWRVVSIPAEDENGEPMAPNVLPRARLDAIKAQIGSTAYSCQYLQRPMDDSTAIIRRAWWRFYRPAHVSEHAPRPAGCDVDTPAVAMPTSFDRVVIAADLTFGSATGDYNAIQAWGSRGGGRYLLEAHRSRAGFESQIEVLEGMARRYPGCAVLVEKAANGAAVIETLRARIAGVKALKPRGSKQARHSAAAPAVESGSCFLPLGAPWLPEFVEELAGATKYDDQADATAYAIIDLATGISHNVDAPGAIGGEVSDAPMPASDAGDVTGGYSGSVDRVSSAMRMDLGLMGPHRW